MATEFIKSYIERNENYDIVHSDDESGTKLEAIYYEGKLILRKRRFDEKGEYHLKYVNIEDSMRSFYNTDKRITLNGDQTKSLYRYLSSKMYGN